MEPQRLLTILSPYLSNMNASDRKEVLHNIALAMEEYGELNYDEIRSIMRQYNTDLPLEMRCKECIQDDGDTILSCDWCGKYFHTKCAKYDTIHCSKQCSDIDYLKNRNSINLTITQ